MELFEAIRREYEFGVGTIQGVARKLGVHRRMVREAPSRTVSGARCRGTKERGESVELAGLPTTVGHSR